MSNPRPRSWYAVPQPYTYQAPGQQSAPPPGAPDFPPVSAAPVLPAEARHYAPSEQHQQSQPQHHSYEQAAPLQLTYVKAPLATSINGGPPAHAAAMSHQWSPGHQSRHSQPTLPSYNGSPYPTLTSPSVDVPVRAKSPKLGGHQNVPPSRQHSAGPLHDPSDISRIRSPQPRRNTVPAPILPQESSLHPIFSPAERSPTPSQRRPLPAPPGPSIISNPTNLPEVPKSGSPSISPSPHLSRSPSAASTSSSSSTGSARRRPLPQPPGLARVAEPESYASPTSSRPASYAEAQAAVASSSFPSHRYPGAMHHHPSAPLREPAHVQDVRARIEEMAINARQAADSKDPREPPAPSASSSPAPPVIQVPSINVPSFAFDEPEEPSASSAPAISISVAPPSPSLKATSSEYFDQHIEDEHVPLPTSSVPMATSTKAYATACPKCERPVLYGRTVNAMGKRWHPDCFVCEQCETKLEHMEFFTKDGKPYCHVDYHELFSIRCNHCKTPIVDESYITIDDPVLGKRQYHELHFFCANCGDPFLDPKGQASDAADPELAAKPFTVHNGYPYCESCNLRLHRPKCNNCKKPIPGDVLKAMNKDWCENCFVCTVCKRPFADGTFVVHQGKPHCELCLRRILLAAATST